MPPTGPQPAARPAAAPSSGGADIIGGRFTPVLCIVGEGPMRLWGKTTAERLRVQFAREGLADPITLGEAAVHKGPVIFVRADAILDAPLIPALIKRSHLLLLGEDGAPLAAHAPGEQAAVVAAVLAGKTQAPPDLKLDTRSPADLETSFWKSLKKRETPYAMAAGEDGRAAIEWRMFMGTYKGATDLVTKYLWPVPAFHVVRWLAPRGVRPNMVTSVALLLVFAAFYAFMKGWYLPGLAAAWLMTFLDTVDGKLARTTLTSSKWGNYFDHGIDLIHPPFWYVAWAMGLGAAGLALAPRTFTWILAAIFAGYILQRIMEGVSTQVLGLTIHIWRPIDTYFRLITARRNPNLVILTASALAGRPDIGIVAVAVWTVVCFFLHAVQLAQAFAQKRRGGISSWMTRAP